MLKASFYLAIAGIFITALSSQPVTYSAAAPEFSYHGRHYSQDGSVRYDWSCFTIAFCFNASKLEWKGADSWNIYQVVVDGTNTQKMRPGKQTKVTIFESPSPERHCLELVKLTQNHFGPLRAFTDSVFQGVNVWNGTLTRKESLYSLKFQFFGDSLTTAFGVDSGRSITCMLRMREIENCLESWASLLSKKFNAEYRIEAISGKGLAKNNYGIPPPTMPHLFTRVTSTSPDNSYRYDDGWVPDILFVMIGANDYSRMVPPSTQRYVDAFKTSMEDTLRKQFQAAGRMSRIVAIAGQDEPKKLQDGVQRAVREMKYAYDQIYYLELPKGTFTINTSGCIAHPNPQGHQKIAQSLYEGVKNILQEI